MVKELSSCGRDSTYVKQSKKEAVSETIVEGSELELH